MTTLADVFAGRERWIVAACDCRFGMASLPSDSVDAVVCDPPYGIGFMGREWDSFSPAETARKRETKRRKGTEGPLGSGELAGGAFIAYDRTAAGNRRFQEWVTEWAREALRVAKPGAYLVAFGGTRTWHRLAAGIEDAGWEIRDNLAWLFGSGFPKSLNVSKAIDASLGAEREIVGRQTLTGSAALSPAEKGGTYVSNTSSHGAVKTIELTRSRTDEGRAAEGYGTALKPAFEPIVVARKPLCGTVAETFMRYGTGALNIDGCRIGDEPLELAPMGGPANSFGGYAGTTAAHTVVGRWPANVVLTHADGCEQIGTRTVRRDRIEVIGDRAGFAGSSMGGSRSAGAVEESIAQWRCVRGCPVAELDAQSGDRPSTPYPANEATGAVLPFTHRSAGGYSDTGGASRFFYTAKASRAERDAGLDEFAPASGGEATERTDGTAGLDSPRAGAGRNGGARNTHPTVKPVELMRWLVRLVTRPGSLVLDPFCGSGTTGRATMREGDGRRFVGLELDPHYVDIARAHLVHDVGGVLVREVTDAPVVKPAQVTIFEAIR